MDLTDHGKSRHNSRLSFTSKLGGSNLDSLIIAGPKQDKLDRVNRIFLWALSEGHKHGGGPTTIQLYVLWIHSREDGEGVAQCKAFTSMVCDIRDVDAQKLLRR